MPSTIDRTIRSLLYAGIQTGPALKRWVKSHPRLASFAFDVWNSGYFNNAEIHEKMLHDRTRIENYYRAISKHVQPGHIAVDLGTGTGVLAFFAAMQQAARVHAIEHSDMIETARHLAAANGLDNIEFHRSNSKDVAIDEKADVLIHEQIGSAIFNENMVENVIDLRDRLLKPDGKILPNRFDVFLEPVQIKQEFQIPFIWEMNIHGISYESLRMTSDGKAAEGSRLQHDRWRFIRNFEIERLVCDPTPVMQFDMETMSADWNPGRIVYQRPAVCDARIDGLLLYFNAWFDDELVIETNPLLGETSWLPSLLRLEQQPIAAGTPVHYELDMPDLRDYRGWNLDWQTGTVPETGSVAEVRTNG